MSRGIRNNNPGNIDYHPANNWKGQLPHDNAIEPRFCRFSAPEYGIRAIMALLRNYQRKYRLNTVADLISRWAPSNENNTNAYVSGVSKALGVSPDDTVSLSDKDTAIRLTKAIIQHENGSQPYSDAVFEKAYALL
ncbi:TPA: structural protein [Morganella morganii]|uniref:structural protein n=1 Tax=Morganella morganii TaxID=582 RepID=UPI00298E800E|nr:structural protein [Morganella morganii]MDW7782619.1 structural protein [Morganella morganii]MDW7790018.1 structural protein [Morganella morganii]HCR3230039.1 structural protein [Morganella morganii]